METYKHGGDVYGNDAVTLDFSVNTNPLGMPDYVREALISRVDDFTRYPDPLCRELNAALASRENVPLEWVLCGNGAADLIYRLCRTIKPRKALVCAPTFSEYERAVKLEGGCVFYHTLKARKNFCLDESILELIVPGVDILFLCHPNNPTGLLIPDGLMPRILDKARDNRVNVVVDECFLDFTDGVSTIKYLRGMRGLIVLKAFTKTYAMAGLRLGYLLTSDTELRNRIDGAAQCWSVSVPAQIAGLAALTGAGWLEKTRRLIAAEKEFLIKALGELSIKVFPSDANYLLVHSARPLYEPLLKKGILIRVCDNFGGLDGSYCRIGIKTRFENVRLIEALSEVQSA